MGIKATKTVFRTRGSFDLFSSKSSDPSKTITIKPIVPNMGNKASSFGISICVSSVICLTPQPKISNKITEGIFVLEAVSSNVYAINNKTHSVIMNGIVILFVLFVEKIFPFKYSKIWY